MRTKQVVTLLAAVLLACAAFAGEGGSESRTTEPAAGRIGKNRVLPPLKTEKYEYHEVCGCCEKDLQCEMSDKAMRWKDGNKYDSITKWKVTWDYAYDRRDHACFADSFRVNIDVTIHLPKWVCSGQPPPSLAEKWGSYIRNLELHEQGHRDRALKAAEALTRAVAEMAPSSNCSELDRKLDQLCRRHMQQLDEEQEKYDAETKHGQVKGIAFP